jgi:hypothetical protein
MPLSDSILFHYNMKFILFVVLPALLQAAPAMAQIPDAVYSPRIQTVQLYPSGNQLGFPVLKLNGGDRLELHFDDLD